MCATENSIHIVRNRENKTVNKQKCKGVVFIHLKVIPLLFHCNLVRIAREGWCGRGRRAVTPWKFQKEDGNMRQLGGGRGVRVVVEEEKRRKGKGTVKVHSRGDGKRGKATKGRGGGGLKRKLYSGQCSPRAVRFNYFCSAPTTLPGSLPFPCPSHSLFPPLPISRCGRGGRRF